MPGTILSPYKQVPVTKADRKITKYEVDLDANRLVVDWAELVTLDLGLFDQPGGKEKLAKQLEHAIHHVGQFS